MESHSDLMEKILLLSRCSRRRPAGDGQAPRGDYRIINTILKNDGIRTTDLAKLLNVRPASLTGDLKRLEEKGFIFRETDADDLRIIHLHGTDAAREKHIKWKADVQDYRERLERCLTDEEAEQFCRIADKLCAFFEAEGSGGPSLSPEEHDAHHSRTKKA